MRKRNLVVALAVAAVLAGGALVASNMGFKVNYPLSGPGSSASGTNTIALPFNPQVGMTDAKDLLDDITAAGGSPGNVQQFIRATDNLATYNGTSGSAFTLSKGEGYRVQMNADLNYIIVGSHDPGAQIVFNGPGSSASGTNLYAVPYHTTAADAKDLIDEINLAGGAGTVGNVQQFIKATDNLATYNGVSGSAFLLSPGEAYRVQVNNDATFTPSHY